MDAKNAILTIWPYTHINTHMKTTLEIPNALFLEAKAVAAQRRITMKVLFTRALERELRPVAVADAGENFGVDAQGWPVLKRPAGHADRVTDALVNQFRESEGI